jgi:hypothetical protein
MLSVCPSPLEPLDVVVTTTNWSFATKLRMHRSLLALSWPGWLREWLGSANVSHISPSCTHACMSNFNECAKGSTNATSSLRTSMIAIIAVLFCVVVYTANFNVVTCAPCPFPCNESPRSGRGQIRAAQLPACLGDDSQDTCSRINHMFPSWKSSNTSRS